MTDIITGGRLELGIARGAYVYEYERLMPGMDAWEAGQRLREVVPAVKKLWAGDYAHEGDPASSWGTWGPARGPYPHRDAASQGPAERGRRDHLAGAVRHGLESGIHFTGIALAGRGFPAIDPIGDGAP